jgi:hypothetical protein
LLLERERSYANYYEARYFLLFLPVTKALADARLKYSDVEQAVVGYCYGKTC